jgi:hypothetical protein
MESLMEKRQAQWPVLPEGVRECGTCTDGAERKAYAGCGFGCGRVCVLESRISDRDWLSTYRRKKKTKIRLKATEQT